MIYVIIHTPGQDNFCSYSGMTVEAIQALWPGVVCEFVDAAVWLEKYPRS